MSSKDLFRMVDGTTVFTFTSSNEAEVYGGETYTPRVVGRSEINDKAQITKATLDITFPIGDSLGHHLLSSSVDSLVQLTVYSKDEFDVFRTEWLGRLKTTAPDGKEIKVTFESIFSSNRRSGARPIFQRTCRHPLYSKLCGISFEANKVAGSVTGMSSDGGTVTCTAAAAKPDGYYSAGVIVMSDGSMRYIVSHSGSTLVLIRSSDVLRSDYTADGSAAVFIAPGCDQTEPTCFTKFANINNFGGWSKMPLEDPIGGVPVV